MTTRPTTEELMQKIKDSLIENLSIDPSQITPEARMRELGVDCMHVVAVLVDLETDLDVRLTDLGFPPNPSLREVAQTIEKSFAPRE